ncbi:MAG: hypothetical protein AAF411_14700 [Myxococcota bacterium]
MARTRENGSFELAGGEQVGTDFARQKLVDPDHQHASLGLGNVRAKMRSNGSNYSALPK